jgi:hypothetical protein
MTEQVTLVLKNDVSELDKVLTLVTEICARHSIPSEIEYDLKLALDEVVPTWPGMPIRKAASIDSIRRSL